MIETKEIEVSEMNSGRRPIVHKSFLTVVPVGYSPGTAIRWKNTILYEARKTIRDKDIKVLFSVLKAYSDNSYEDLNSARAYKGRGSDVYVEAIKVNVKEISNAAFPSQRARSQHILESMERISALNMHLLNENLESVGFIKIISGAKLVDGNKYMELGINGRFLLDMMRNLISYDFKTAMGFEQRAFRLYIAMQGFKYCINEKKGWYAYMDYIPDFDLKVALNLQGENAQREIAKSFKDIGLNYSYNKHKKRWEKGRDPKRVETSKSV